MDPGLKRRPLGRGRSKAVPKVKEAGPSLLLEPAKSSENHPRRVSWPPGAAEGALRIRVKLSGVCSSAGVEAQKRIAVRLFSVS